MLPHLHAGDWLVVRWGARPRPGDIVVVRRPDRPALLIVKRAVRRVDGGWELRGDNPLGSDDSRLFGLVDDDFVSVGPCSATGRRGGASRHAP